MATPALEHVAYVATTDHVSCDLGGETVLLGLADGVYYGLNTVAARIWELLRQPQTATQLRDAIVREFDVSAARCAHDLDSFLVKLRERALLVDVVV
jgi:hypothetical protein